MVHRSQKLRKKLESTAIKLWAEADKLMAEADKLNQRKEKIEAFLSLLDEEDMPKEYKGSLKDYQTLIFNNYRLGIDEEYVCFSVSGGIFDYEELSRCLYRFIEANPLAINKFGNSCSKDDKFADPLAKKLREYLRSLNMGIVTFDEERRKTSGKPPRIVEKLIARTMTKEEYFGYLESKLPVGWDIKTKEPKYFTS